MPSGRRLGPGPARVLVVCTGNLCRSPLAERLLGAALLETPVVVESAGTMARSGEPMEPGAALELARRGLSGDDFRARVLDGRLVEDADLVLCAERVHRAAVATLVPTAVSRTFTLGELARLLEGTSPAPTSPVGLAALAAGRRGRARPGRSRDDDLDDPFGRRQEAFSRCATELERLLEPVIVRLGGRRPGQP